MKKIRISLIFVLIASMFLLVACGKTETDDNHSTTQLLNISGITFVDAEYEYDGTEKELLISENLPSGISAVYTNNKATDPGTYNAKVVLSGEGYNSLTLTAKLTITVDESAAEITGVSLENGHFVFDGTEKSIIVSGEIPQGVEVSYTNNKGTNAGTYNTKAILSGDGFKVLVLNASLIIDKATITGISFENKTFTYDGSEKSIEINGTLPSGVTANYSSNKGTNAATYNSTVVLSGANYEQLSINAKLIINKADITGIILNGDSVEYDTFIHSIEVVGNVPSGVSVVYTYNENEVDGVFEAGSYNVVATLSGANYNTEILSAVLKITASEELLHSTVFNNSVYFQNNLDDNKLYKVGTTGAGLSKVSNDIANYFVSSGNTLYFHSKGLLSSSISELKAGSIEKLFKVSANYLATDGTNFYYSISNLVNYKNTNGIYKVNLSAEDVVPVKLTNDKASHLVYYNNYIYYINLSNGDKLSKIATTANEGISSVVVDRTCEELIIDSGILYYTAKDGALNWKIFKYVLSSSTETELTSNRGKYLTVVGNQIYYVNIDLLTTTLFGKGIYRTATTGFGTSEKIIENADNGFSSLSSDGNSLYYYKLNNKHFYRYSISSGTEIDLMQSFTPVEDALITDYTQITEYNGELYYINPLDKGSVYKYNLTTKAKYKILSENVSNIYFNDGYIYYSTYVLTNYALFRLDLSTNESVKIATHRADNLIFVGDYIYYSRVKVVGSNNSLNRMDLDGKNQEELYDGQNVYISSLEYKNGNIYFCSNPILGKKTLYAYDIATNTATSLSENAEIILLYQNDIYFYYDKKIKKISINGGTATTLETETSAEITFMYECDGIIYYSATKSNAEALYSYNIATGVNTKLVDGPASAIYKSGNTLYYIKAKVTYNLDYPKTSGNGHLFSLNLTTKVETKIA